MADYKDYIVRYDIQTNVANAAIGLREMISVAEQLQTPLKTVQEAITQVSSAARLLRESVKEPLKLTLNTGTFKGQIDEMVTEVERAAAKMHASIYNALKGNPQGIKTTQTGIKQAIASKESQLRSEIKGLQDRIKELGNTRTGAIFNNRFNPAKQAELKEEKENAKALLREKQKALKEEERIQKQIASVQSKATAQAQKATTAATKTSPTSNVSVAQMKAWKQLFGKSNIKSLTLNVIDEATPVIKLVQASLESLKALGKFEVIPTLNKAAYTNVERQLTQLAALSQKIANPLAGVKEEKSKGGVLGKEDKAKLAAAQKQLKSLNQAAAPIQTRLNKNLAIPEEQRTRGIKAQITKDTKALGTLATQAKEQERIIAGIRGKAVPATQQAIASAKPVTVEVIGNLSKINVSAKLPEIPVGVKIMTSQVAASLKSIPRQTLPVNIKLTWGNGAVGKQAELKKLASNVPPINLILDASAATAELEAFIAKVRASSPQNIALTATGSAAAGAVGKGASSAQKSGASAGTTGHQSLTPRQYRDKLAQTLGKPTAVSDKILNQRFGIGGGMGARAAAIEDARAAFAQPTPFERADKSMAPSGFSGTGKNRIFYGSSRPSAEYAPKGYHWESATNLQSGLTPAQIKGLEQARVFQSQAMQSLIAARDKASAMTARADKVRNIGRLLSNNTTTAQNTLANAQNTKRMLETQMQSFQQQLRSLEEMEKAFGQVKKLNANQKRALANIQASKAPIVSQLQQLQSMHASNEQVISRQSSIIATQQARQARYAPILAQAEKAEQMAAIDARERAAFYTGARQRVEGYTHGWKLAKDETPKVGKPSQASLDRYQRILAQRHNALLPFNLSSSQMSAVEKNWKFFAQAAKTSGIRPVAGMEQAQMLRYLQAVSAQMQAANVAVPYQLQKQIATLESGGQTTGGRGGRVVWGGAPQKPAWDRFRKWSYAMTGPTSFGVKTPMAVDMAKGMGVMFAIGGAMSAISNSFGQAVGYQNTMKTTEAILKNGSTSFNPNAFKAMERNVRNIGVKTKFSAPEVADAARFLAMAGYNIDDINNAIRPIADLALIGDTDLGETADKMTNVMTGFGIKPEEMRQAANIMTTTMTRSNTDLMMLAESAKYGGGVARIFNGSGLQNFADTMAIFGVMGNSGVQASSAGTALRMMYLNLFNPNGKQAKILAQLKEKGILDVYDSKGGRRSMADIMIDLANNLDPKESAEIISKLFRVTAIPGANATLIAGVTEDKMDEESATNVVESANQFASALVDPKQAKLTPLVALLQANRASINSTISQDTSEAKQNTIQGLWAQVTSMFTEAITQVFEQRTGYFEDVLKKVRDYFANPETITMIQNLIDMILKIGEVMAWFVKMWANLYNAIPGVVKWWVVIQMAMTQIGSLMAPISMLMVAFGKLRDTIAFLSGTTVAANANMAGGATANAAAGAALIGAPLGTNRAGTAFTKGTLKNVATKANTANAILAGQLALSGADRTQTLKALTKETAPHYAALQERYVRRYPWKRIPLSLKQGMATTFSMASFSGLFGGIKSMFIGLISVLAKALGFLASPVGIAATVIGGLGYAVYKLNEYVSGNTQAQIEHCNRMKEAVEKTNLAMANNLQWYKDKLDSLNKPSSTVEGYTPTKEQQQVQATKKQFDEIAADVRDDIVQSPSAQTNDTWVTNWRSRYDSNPLIKFAIGNDYEQLVGSNLNPNVVDEPIYDTHAINNTDAAASALATRFTNWAMRNRRFAKHLQPIQFQTKLREMAALDPRIQQFEEKIYALRQEVFASTKTEAQYQQEAIALRDSIISQNAIKSLQATPTTLQDFNKIVDPTGYYDYGQGLYNILGGLMNGQYGSYISKINAEHNLTNGLVTIQNNAKQYWEAVSLIVGEYPITFKQVNGEGVVSTVENMVLSMDQNGKVNWQPIIKQIEDKITGFKVKVQDMLNMMADVYSRMAALGVISWDEAEQSLRDGFKHHHISRADAEAYYYKYIKNSKNWKGVSVEQYVDWVTNPNQADLSTSDGKVRNSPATQRVIMRNTMAQEEIDKTIKPAKEAAEKAAKMAGQKDGNTDTSSTSTTTTNTPTKPTAATPPPATDQDAYASAYDRSVARPTQIVFNINEMAHFDRTTVASSAEERDLIAAMEAKIAPAVYQIFAQAANQANNMKLA